MDCVDTEAWKGESLTMENKPALLHQPRLQPARTMKFKDSVPVISTADIRSTLDWYVRVLGFREHFVFGDPPVYAGLECDGVLLYVTHDPALASTMEKTGGHPDIFLWVEGIDEAFELHRTRGARVIEPPADRAWDARQYVLEDPNGYRLKIAQSIDV
jgi:catechol 2,3-dioxygenase-like lactoylglutathione lyase family enzyme